MRADDDIVDALRECLRASTADHLRSLANLIDTHGEEVIGRLHSEWLAGEITPWPVLGQVLARLAQADRSRLLLLADGEQEVEAERVAVLAGRQAGWLLRAVAESGEAGRLPVPESLVDALRLIADEPWFPLAFGEAPSEQPLVAAMAAFQSICREQVATRERDAVAAEIRRVVALSGLSQRAFAEEVGTSASRFSSYANGRVVPSANMMLRIKRTARLLVQADLEVAGTEHRVAS